MEDPSFLERAGEWTAGLWAALMDAAGTELRATDFATVAIRLAVAMLCGALIGAEREWRSRPAGLRTHILVALAAALFTAVALELLALPAPEDDRLRVDPIRLIEAVTSGVAFLAAGSIIVSRGAVRGVTTGAGMWLAGVVGVAAGYGLFQLALLATLLALVVLGLLARIEDALVRPEAPPEEPPARDQRGEGGEEG